MPKNERRDTVIRISIVVLVLASVAHADRGKAEHFFRAGTKAYQAQHFLDAAQNFEQAYRELAAPEIAFSAAQAYRRQARVDPTNADYAKLAVKYYRIYLDQVKTGGRIGDAADSLGEMQRELDKLGATGKAAMAVQETTRLGVSVVFADKQVSSTMAMVDDTAAAPPVEIKTSIDGKPVEPYALNPVDPGDHVVRAEAEGYHSGEKKVHVIAGAPENVELELVPLPARVSVVAEPGATINVDGRAAGVTPAPPIEMPAGKHLITLLRPGREALALEITTKRAEDRTVHAALHTSRRRRAVPYVLFAAGGLAVFTGVAGLGAWHWDHDAKTKLATLQTQGDQDPAVLDAYRTSRSRRDTIETTALVTGGAALAVAAIAAGLYYFDHPSAEGVHVTPIASGTGAGAMVFGRF